MNNDVWLDLLEYGGRTVLGDDIANKPHVYAQFIGERWGYVIKVQILGQKLDRAVVSYPSTWWQAFKERWFPTWVKRWWPVLYTERVMEAVVLLPKMKIPTGEEHQLYFTIDGTPAQLHPGNQTRSPRT